MPNIVWVGRGEVLTVFSALMTNTKTLTMTMAAVITMKTRTIMTAAATRTTLMMTRPR